MVNHFTLVIGNVIVFQNLFTHIEVAAFDFTLCAFDLTGQQTVFDGNTAFRKRLRMAAARSSAKRRNNGSSNDR